MIGHLPRDVHPGTLLQNGQAMYLNEVIQIVGSLLVLAGFALAQRGVIDQRSRSYLLLNLLGSGALAAEAILERQWGFLLLEGVWAIVSALSLKSTFRRRPAQR